MSLQVSKAFLWMLALICSAAFSQTMPPTPAAGPHLSRPGIADRFLPAYAFIDPLSASGLKPSFESRPRAFAPVSSPAITRFTYASFVASSSCAALNLGSFHLAPCRLAQSYTRSPSANRLQNVFTQVIRHYGMSNPVPSNAACVRSISCSGSYQQLLSRSAAQSPF
jgi:hypothetical protein